MKVMMIIKMVRIILVPSDEDDDTTGDTGTEGDDGNGKMVINDKDEGNGSFTDVMEMTLTLMTRMRDEDDNMQDTNSDEDG